MKSRKASAKAGRSLVFFLGFRCGEARRIGRFQRIPVEPVEFGIGVFAAEEIQHRAEGIAVAKIGKIVDGGGFRLDQIDDRAGGAIESEGPLVHIDHRVSGWHSHNRIIVGEKHAIVAEAGGEALPRLPARRL